MKKLVATGTILALLLAASSPAMAQTTFGDEFLFVDASQAQFAAALQTNEGDVNAGADDDSWADASIDQSLTIDQTQINGGFNDGFDDFDDDFVVFFD
jgi:xylose isomerase